MCAHAGFKRCKRYYYMLIWELSFRGKNVFYSLEIILFKNTTNYYGTDYFLP